MNTASPLAEMLRLKEVLVGVALGIVGTVVLALYIAWWVVFVWAIRSLE